jgi:hypothetical protein
LKRQSLIHFCRIFIHGGFTNVVSDFDFSKVNPWQVIAASEDNQIQAFIPARRLVMPADVEGEADDDDDVDDVELDEVSSG